MSKINMNDTEGADLSRVYAATARDEPPAALDGEILAQARRAAENRARASFRHWRRPVAIAATLIVTASLVVLMESEQPQIAMLAPPAGDAALAPAAKAPAEAVQPAKVAPAQAARREKKPASSGTLDLPARDAFFEPSSREREPPASPRPVLPDAASPIASNNVPGAALAERRSVQATDNAARDLLKTGPAQKDESPEAWLAHIAELRKQGRIKEAEESLAAFRKRYPDYPIPAAKAPINK